MSQLQSSASYDTANETCLDMSLPSIHKTHSGDHYSAGGKKRKRITSVLHVKIGGSGVFG